MKRWSDRVALVTGASSGIGAAISRELVKHGVKVVGVARRLEKIQNLEKELKDEQGQLYPVKGDVTLETDILKIFDWIKENFNGVDILVNNAGIGISVPVKDFSTDRFRSIFDLNVIGLSICTREAIKSMKEKGIDDGHIININSICGHYVPYIAGDYPYTASKHAVTVLTEGLRRELAQIKSNIKVTSISPGLVETEMLYNATSDYPDGDVLRNSPVLQAKDIADAVMYVLETPPHVLVQELIVRPVGETL